MSQYKSNSEDLTQRPIKIKICGMNQNTVQVSTLKPEYLGFIFWKPSKRYHKGDIDNIPHGIQKVGVFVDESLDEIIRLTTEHQLNLLQLHGTETPEFCSQLKSQIKGIRIIKVFSVKHDFNFSVLNPYENVCDFFLFDTKGELPGGNGYKFNWKLLEQYPSTKPYFLSGGIGLNDIDNLKSFLQKEISKYCHAIDINSKFEIEPGLKNTEDLKLFIKKLR